MVLVSVKPAPAQPSDIETPIAALAREQRSGLIVLPNSFTQYHRKLVLDLAVFRRHVSDADENVIALKLLQELDIAGYEIVKKPRNAGFTLETPGGDDAA